MDIMTLDDLDEELPREDLRCMACKYRDEDGNLVFHEHNPANGRKCTYCGSTDRFPVKRKARKGVRRKRGRNSGSTGSAKTKR